MAENTPNTNQTPVNPTPEKKADILDDISVMIPQESSTSNLMATAESAKEKAAAQGAPKEIAVPNLDDLEQTVGATEPAKEKKIDFSVTKQSTPQEKAMKEAVFERTFFNKMTTTVTLALVFLLLGFFGYVFQQYIRHVEGKSVSSVIDYYMPSIHKTYIQISKLLGQNSDIYRIDSLTTPYAQQNLNAIVSDRSLNYITKKEILDKAVDQLVRSTTTQYSRLDEIKQDIG